MECSSGKSLVFETNPSEGNILLSGAKSRSAQRDKNMSVIKRNVKEDLPLYRKQARENPTGGNMRQLAQATAIMVDEWGWAGSMAALDEQINLERIARHNQTNDK